MDNGGFLEMANRIGWGLARREGRKVRARWKGTWDGIRKVEQKEETRSIEESGTARRGEKRKGDLGRKGSSRGEERRKKGKDLSRKGTVRPRRSEVENVGKETREAGGE